MRFKSVVSFRVRYLGFQEFKVLRRVGCVAMRASKQDWFRWANHDFCPGLNRYVYWLKEPVGWFVLATLCSLLVGVFLSPLGWTVAMGLLGVLVLGLGFPWIATKAIYCELTPHRTEVHEGDSSHLILQVTNRLPFPVMGLLIEGWDSDSADGPPLGNDKAFGSVGLARVPGWSKASYRLPYEPQYRGRYPKGQPKIACSFPFGIWTARRSLHKVQPVTVWPMLIPVQGSVEVSGNKRAESGFGQRVSTTGDFLGTRDFRQGDSLKSIHWVQSARLDQWIVCERGGPQRETLELCLDTSPSLGTKEERRENLAWRVRIAASLTEILVAHHVPFRLFIDGEPRTVGAGGQAREACFDLLAEIDLDGSNKNDIAFCNPTHGRGRSSEGSVAGRWRISATGDNESQLDSHHVKLSMEKGGTGIRAVDQSHVRLIHLDEDIATQVNYLLMEVSRESCTA